MKYLLFILFSGCVFAQSLQYTPRETTISLGKSFTGTFIIGTAGDTLTFGDVVYLNNLDNKLYKSDVDVDSTISGLLAIVIGGFRTASNDSLLPDETGRFLYEGFLTNTSWTKTSGDAVYLSSLGGTTESPVIPEDRRIGIVIDTNKVAYFPNVFSTIKTGTTAYVKGVISDRKDHGFYAFEDSSVVIDCTKDTWVQITNAANDLFTAIQTNEGFIISGDTITFNSTDSIASSNIHILFHWGIDGHGGNNEDFEVRIYDITNDAGIVRKAEGSGTGANNRIEIGTTSYARTNIKSGNKFILQIMNKTNNNDFTVENGSIYMEVSHY